MSAIPTDTALHLCGEILEENAGKWYTLGAMQCWGCLLFSESAFERMCVISPKGCSMVNERFERQAREGAQPPRLTL